MITWPEFILAQDIVLPQGFFFPAEIPSKCNFLCELLRGNHLIVRGRLVKWGVVCEGRIKAPRERVESALKAVPRLEIGLEKYNRKSKRVNEFSLTLWIYLASPRGFEPLLPA
jgi:hypothetical protein